MFKKTLLTFLLTVSIAFGAALDFPTSPTTGQVSTQNGKTYAYDGTTWALQSQSVAPAASIAARVYNSATQSVTNTTVVPITFDTHYFATDSTIHSTSSNTSRFLAPSAGYYTGTCATAYAANATGTRYLYYRLNGTTDVVGSQSGPRAVSGSVTQGVQTQLPTLYLAATDYVECIAYQDSGSTLNIGSGSLGTTSSAATFYKVDQIIGATSASSLTNTYVGFGAASVMTGVAGFTFDGTSVLTLGVAGTSVGGVKMNNATSGSVTISPVTGALGTITISAPALTGVMAVSGAALTTGRVPYATTGGALTDSASLRFTGTNFGVGTAGAPAALLDIGTSNTAYDTTATVARITNASATGQSPLDFYINGTLRGRVRTDYSGNLTLVANGGNISMFTGGDSGVGAIRHTLYASGGLGHGATYSNANDPGASNMNIEGKLSIGVVTPTAKLHIAAGGTGANTAPIKLVSGSLNSTPEVGAIEFLTDKAYMVITTGTARKELAMADAALTSGRVPYNTTNGRLTDAAGYLFDGTSKVTLGVAGTSVGSIDLKNATSGTITLAPVTGALGTVTVSIPATAGTAVVAPTGTPTMGSCGSSPAIAGNDLGMIVTVGTGGSATSCAVTFATTATNAPVCVVNSDTDIVAMKMVTTTTTATVSATAPFTASSKLHVICSRY